MTKLNHWTETHPAIRKVVIAALQKELAAFELNRARDNAITMAMLESVSHDEAMLAGASTAVGGTSYANASIASAFRSAIEYLNQVENEG